MQWDKKYHTLMPPFLLGGIGLMAFLPSRYYPYILLVVPTIFWSVYYIWKQQDKK